MLQLNGNFQPAEDKAIGRFVGIIRGPAGTGKSSLLGAAYNGNHPILVADIENKGWGKYPRIIPEDPTIFYSWMDLLLDILQEPLQDDGFVHLSIDGVDLAIDTLGIDTLDRLQELAMLSLGNPGRDARSWWGDLLNLFKPFLKAIDDSPLNVIIINHVQEKTPVIAESKRAEAQILSAASKKSDDTIDISDLHVEDLGIGIYDYATNALAGALGRKIDEHMHFILNVIRSPDGESILAATDVKVNGVWYPAKDDFGLFQRQNINLAWHETDALILNDPLGILWDATTGRDRLIATSNLNLPQASENGEKTERDDAATIAMENKVNEGISKFITEFRMIEDEWADVLKSHPLSAAVTLDEIQQVGLTTLKQLSNVVIKNEVAGMGISGANEILAPVIDAMVKTNSPKDIFRLTEEGLALLELAVDEVEPAGDVMQSQDEELEIENIDAIAF